MQQDGQGALSELMLGVLPYLGYAILIIAVLFFLKMAFAINRDAAKRARLRHAHEDRLNRGGRHPR